MRWSCIRAFGSLKFEIAHLSLPSDGRKYQDERHGRLWSCGYYSLCVCYLSSWVESRSLSECPMLCIVDRACINTRMAITMKQFVVWSHRSIHVTLELNACANGNCLCSSLFSFLTHALHEDLKTLVDFPLLQVYFGPPYFLYLCKFTYTSAISCTKYNRIYNWSVWNEI